MTLPRRVATVPLLPRHVDALGRLAGDRPWASALVDLVIRDVAEPGVREGVGPVVLPNEAETTLAVPIPGRLLDDVERRRGEASLPSFLLGLLEEAADYDTLLSQTQEGRSVAPPHSTTSQKPPEGGNMKSDPTGDRDVVIPPPKPIRAVQPPRPRVLDAEARTGTRTEFDRLRLRLRRGENPWPRVVIVPALDHDGVEEVRQALSTDLLEAGDALRLILSLDKGLRALGMDEAELAATWARLLTILRSHAADAGVSILPRTATFAFAADEEQPAALHGGGQDMDEEDDDDDNEEVPAVGVLLVELTAQDPLEVAAGASLHAAK